MILPHRAHADFWVHFDELLETVQKAAKAAYEEWCRDPRSPRIVFKKVGEDLYSARIGRNWRALALLNQDEFVWFWIGSHDDYDQLIS